MEKWFLSTAGWTATALHLYANLPDIGGTGAAAQTWGTSQNLQPFVADVTEIIVKESELAFEIAVMGISWEGLSLGWIGVCLSNRILHLHLEVAFHELIQKI